MREIRELAAQIVQRTRHYAETKVEEVFPDFQATCPLCGAHGLKSIATSLSCQTPKCTLRVGKTIAQRPMSEAELHAWLDGELPEERLADVERHLADHPEVLIIKADEKSKQVHLSDQGHEHVEDLFLEAGIGQVQPQALIAV